MILGQINMTMTAKFILIRILFPLSLCHRETRTDVEFMKRVIVPIL